MDQETLVREVLATIPTLPSSPQEGHFLSPDEADSIVGNTLAWLAGNGDPVEYRYLSGHRRRLTTTLTMIPKAPHPDASLIDVGCYGYMAYWAHRHLGYARVEGIELRPDVEERVIERHVRLGDDNFTFSVFNIDISKPGWTMPRHDTVLLLETLEHVNEDPSGVLERIAAGMPEGGTLVMSVPNAISYKTLNEILMGAPPWTYWFFHPDLRHEPRHAFEYTPTFFTGLLRAAGFRPTAFRTLVAYAERDALDDIFALGRALSIDEHLFGETMIAHAVKDSAGGVIRYPDMIYDGDAYYRSTWPQISPRGREALSAFLSKWGPNSELVRHAEERAEAAETARTETLAMLLAATIKVESFNEKLAQADAQLRHAADLVKTAEAAATYASTELANKVAQHQEAEYRIRSLEHNLQEIFNSTSWRATAPLRRLLEGYPGLRGGFRNVARPFVRALRRLIRR